MHKSLFLYILVSNFFKTYSNVSRVQVAGYEFEPGHPLGKYTQQPDSDGGGGTMFQETKSQIPIFLYKVS